MTGGAYADTTAGTTQTDAFAYDGSGNRTRSTRNSTLTAYVPNAADQYASVGGTAQSYDAAGNQTLVKLPDGPGLTLSYDAENRLLTEERNAGVVASDKAHVVNTYDALQRRIMKQAYIRNPANTAWVLGKTILFTYEPKKENGKQCSRAQRIDIEVDGEYWSVAEGSP